MAAEVIAGAAALLDARERLRGIEAAAEAALDVSRDPPLRARSSEAGARSALDARTMPFSPATAERPMVSSSVRTISTGRSLVSSGATYR